VSLFLSPEKTRAPGAVTVYPTAMVKVVDTFLFKYLKLLIFLSCISNRIKTHKFVFSWAVSKNIFTEENVFLYLLILLPIL
jgi:hypothetical protein